MLCCRLPVAEVARLPHAMMLTKSEPAELWRVPLRSLPVTYEDDSEHDYLRRPSNGEATPYRASILGFRLLLGFGVFQSGGSVTHDFFSRCTSGQGQRC